MPLSHIEHYLVLSDEIDATRDWYRDVLGMQEGWHPDFGFPVYWMYLGGVDVVHIGKSAKHAGESQKAYLGRLAQDAGAGTGAIDHIAFRAKDLRETLAHLRRQRPGALPAFHVRPERHQGRVEFRRRRSARHRAGDHRGEAGGAGEPVASIATRACV